MELEITKTVAAPVRNVWEAWTDPEKVKRWWAPEGLTCPSAKIDFKVGHKSIVCMRSPPGNGRGDMYSTWTYKKIVPQKRIEFIHDFSDKQGNFIDPVAMGMPSDFPKHMLFTVEFKEMAGERTLLTVAQHGWKGGQMMEFARTGLNQSLDKMGGIFARQ